MKTFRPYEPDQLLLLPPSIQEWLPEDHLARFISEVVDTLELSAIEGNYLEERGFPPYHPRMMTKVLLYGYCTGTYSSRKLAEKLSDSVAFRYLAAGNRPDFRTINDFRKQHGRALEGLFGQVLSLCQKAGLVKLGRVAVDGTKLKANASKHKAMSYGRMVDRERELKRQIEEMFDRAEAIDREEDKQYGKDRTGNELPADLATREGRLRKIREAKAALEEEARQKAAAEGKDPEKARPPAKAQRNFTDPDSKIQKSPDGYLQGYNGQLAVDEKSQVIVAQLVTASSPDVEQLRPVIEKLELSLGRRPKKVLADAGYWSESNVRHLEAQQIEPLIAPGRMKHNTPAPSSPRGRTPAGLTAKELMWRKLRTKQGHADYARRKAIVEAPFGQIKQARGFRQFLRRGLEQVQQEWALICTAHNLLKLRAVWA